MIRIVAPHFVAGVIFNDRDICVLTAPIVQYLKGKTKDEVLQFCAKKNWRVSEPPTNGG